MLKQGDTVNVEGTFEGEWDSLDGRAATVAFKAVETTGGVARLGVPFSSAVPKMPEMAKMASPTDGSPVAAQAPADDVERRRVAEMVRAFREDAEWGKPRGYGPPGRTWSAEENMIIAEALEASISPKEG